MISFRLDVERKERKERDPGWGRVSPKNRKILFCRRVLPSRNCRGSLEIVYLGDRKQSQRTGPHDDCGESLPPDASVTSASDGSDPKCNRV